METKNIDRVVGALINHLVDLATGVSDPENPEHGVCKEVSNFITGKDLSASEFDKIIETMYESFPSWKHFSKCRSFPVPPADSHHKTAHQAYCSSVASMMWGNGAYGQLRRDLCLHIAKYLRRTLNYER